MKSILEILLVCTQFTCSVNFIFQKSLKDSKDVSTNFNFTATFSPVSINITLLPLLIAAHLSQSLLSSEWAAESMSTQMDPCLLGQ